VEYLNKNKLSITLNSISQQNSIIIFENILNYRIKLVNYFDDSDNFKDIFIDSSYLYAILHKKIFDNEQKFLNINSTSIKKKLELIYKELEQNFQQTTHTSTIKDVNTSSIKKNEQISKDNKYYIYVYVYIYYVNLHIINKWYNIFAKYEGYSIDISKYEELMPEFINLIYNYEDANKIKLQFETEQSAIKNVTEGQQIFKETTNEDILKCIKNIDNIDTTSNNDDVENIISKNPKINFIDITECLQQIHELNILKFTEQKACQDFLETIKNNININFSIGDIYSKTKDDMANKYNSTKILSKKYSDILISFKKKTKVMNMMTQLNHF